MACVEKMLQPPFIHFPILKWLQWAMICSTFTYHYYIKYPKAANSGSLGPFQVRKIMLNLHMSQSWSESVPCASQKHGTPRAIRSIVIMATTRTLYCLNWPCVLYQRSSLMKQSMETCSSSLTFSCNRDNQLRFVASSLSRQKIKIKHFSGHHNNVFIFFLLLTTRPWSLYWWNGCLFLSYLPLYLKIA